MGTNPTIDKTEPLAKHVQDARSMRYKHTKDGNTASSTHIVTTIDFSQNIAMPHSAQTPSMWYFLSLLNILVFGIHNQPDNKQWNYVYSERKAGKGSNEVISMLDWFARTQIIYGDCIGDNKAVKSVSFNFLIKGHTKNNCDRGFANLKRYYAKRDMWNLDMVNDTIEGSATSNTTRKTFLQGFKFPLQNLYKDLKGIQSYQIFTMDSSEPCKVRCQKRQSSAAVVVDLLRRKTDEVLSDGDIAEFWTSIKTATPPSSMRKKLWTCTTRYCNMFPLNIVITPYT
ncbi:hypothetical protein GN958_ATG12190 [Phytophthora infestans]|uniref:DUF7869 domain-containing protein n=1 Tax=Phytophthora infestans TaxID=4787 RepID=A0A8S9UBY5_PHYIN|nr:hypothetical protein GN958_ATG12190 [Phytophthora infestans]